MEPLNNSPSEYSRRTALKTATGLGLTEFPICWSSMITSLSVPAGIPPPRHISTPAPNQRGHTSKSKENHRAARTAAASNGGYN